ncbi:hypothetical protein NEIPOLOT_02542 [Neisseria polysaccharea ATCC 43768]|nr:hypothetical protein NEIPOLOT_02542 [Neisseria polysaccharea ATCC 43768]
MLDVFFQLRYFVQLIDLAVHAHPRKTLRLQVGKEIDKLALTLAHRRRQNHHTRVFRQLQYGIDHLRYGLARQRQIVFGAIRCADAGVQKAQVIMDFRYRADGGTRVVAGGFLLDGNRGRETFDQIDIGFVHHLQKLPRIGGKALDITPLPFGIQRVKRQRRLAAARQSCYHHELVARNVQIDVFQIMRARAADADGVVVVRMLGMMLAHNGCRLKNKGKPIL